MTWTVHSTDLRRRVREVLERVRLRREPAVIHSYNLPQAVIIPYEDFEAYQEWRERREEQAVWLAELRAIAQEVSTRAALDPADADALIAEAKRETRTG